MPLAVLVLVCLSMISCSHNASNEGQAGHITLINIAGATFPYPIYSKWFDVYHQLHPTIEINYQSIGSGGGIEQLRAGTVDFGASDMPAASRRHGGFRGIRHASQRSTAQHLQSENPSLPNSAWRCRAHLQSSGRNGGTQIHATGLGGNLSGQDHPVE